jgi:hypothetical protein
LAGGQHSITAKYAGDANDASSSANTVTETVQVLGTTTTLAPSVNPVSYGLPVTFSATVSTSGSYIPTGTVIFYDGATQLAATTLNGAGVATYATQTLAAGLHSITAKYAGDANDASSSSNLVTETVQILSLTGTALSASNLATGAITLTATVVGSQGTPTGTVTFWHGPRELASVDLDSTGTATYRYETKPLHLPASFSARYSGNGVYKVSTGTLNLR